jgi:hypothetical protein
MKVSTIEGSGRGIIATKAFVPGETMMEEEAYFFVPLVAKNSSLATCLSCLKQFPSAVEHLRCPGGCKGHYCCGECLAAHSPRHEQFGECQALRLVEPLRRELSVDDFNHAVGIAALAVRAAIEGEAVLLAEPAPRRKVAYRNPPELELVYARRAENPSEMELDKPKNTIASVARLTTNMSRFEEDQLDSYRAIAAKYELLRQQQKGEIGEDEEPDEETGDSGSDTCLPYISEFMFLKLSCAYQCNGFSAWNEHDKEVASGMFGYAAMVNHSCSPNIRKLFMGRKLLFAAVKPIAAGEQLFLSYVDVKLARNLRQWRLSTQYFFDCLCPRCEKCDL